MGSILLIWHPIPQAVRSLFDLPGIREVGGQMGIHPPHFTLNSFVQSKMPKVPLLCPHVLPAPHRFAQ